MEKVKLKEVSVIVRGGSPRPMGSPKYFGGSIPFLKIADVTRSKGKFVNKSDITVNENGAKKSRLLPKGTLILTNSGTVCVPKFLGVDACIHDGFVAFTNIDKSRIKDEFLYHYFNYFRPLVIQTHKQGITQVNLNTTIVSEFELPLPPLLEQHAIVERIEELFSELDNGVANLRKTQQQLKTYRQSVLKWAFEGKLTDEWRKSQNRRLDGLKDDTDSQKSAKSDNPQQSAIQTNELLTQIKQEREKRYQKQLEAWKQQVKIWENNGKEGRKPAKPKAHKELPPLTEDELSQLPELPEGWCWVKVDKIADPTPNSLKAGPFGSSLKKSFYVDKGFKIYGQEQVISGDPFIGDYYISQDKYNELISCKIEPFDLLISLVGTVGKVLILPNGVRPGIINPRLIKISLNRSFYSPLFFKYYFESEFLKSLYEVHSHGATMNILNLSIIKGLPFPLPSLQEQHQIVQEIESRLSGADQMEQSINQSLKQAEALRQSILKMAFDGRLTAKWREGHQELLSLSQNQTEK